MEDCKDPPIRGAVHGLGPSVTAIRRGLSDQPENLYLTLLDRLTLVILVYWDGFQPFYPAPVELLHGFCEGF